jgi:flagellar hook-associated protein 1 FlgK
VSGLNTSLAISTQALEAQEAAISITSNNIANSTTPGYSRETVDLTESAPTQQDGVLIGGGVTLQGYDSVRDQLLNLQIQSAAAQQGSANAQASALQTVQTLVASSDTGSLSADLSSFFSSVSALSASPALTANREAVISAGQSLANQFNSTSQGLSSQQSTLNTNVTTDVAEINQIGTQIAALNPQLVSLKAQGQDTGAVQDQIGAFELKLAGLTNIAVTQTAQGDVVTTGSGTPLVDGAQSFALQTAPGSNGLQQVEDSNGTNITSSISGGNLGGTLITRDTTIPMLLNQLDALANQFATAINTAQASGYDQNGNTGAALFTVSGTVGGSAASIQMTTADPSAIAASSGTGGISDGSGSNGNVSNLTAVQNASLPSGASPTTAISSLVYQVGTLTSEANTASTSLASSLSQLNQQLSSVSGVSTDEEAANLIRYQQAYQAAAQVVNTINTLFSTTISMMN